MWFDGSRVVVAVWELGATLTTGTAADRRGWHGCFREDDTSPDPNEDDDGFVTNDVAWYSLMSQLDWVAGNDVEATRQVVYPVTDLVTAGWSKDGTNFFDDVDDGLTTDNATTEVVSPNNPSNSVIAWKLGTITDPQNDDAYGTLAVGYRRHAGARSGTFQAQIREGYVDEGTPGSARGDVGTLTLDAQTDYGGAAVTIDQSAVVNWDNLQLRCVADTSGGGSTTRIAITIGAFIVDGAPDAGVSLVIPTRRHGARLAI